MIRGEGGEEERWKKGEDMRGEEGRERKRVKKQGRERKEESENEG